MVVSTGYLKYPRGSRQKQRKASLDEDLPVLTIDETEEQQYFEIE